MNILMVITKGEVGGAQIVAKDLAVAMTKCGYEVTVAYGDGDYLEKELDIHSIKTTRLSALKRSHNPFSNLFFIFELKKFLDREKFDIVHFHSSNALIGAIGVKLSKYKPKSVFTVHGLSLIDKNYEAPGVLKFFYFILFKFLLKFIDHPVFISANNLAYARAINLTSGGNLIKNGIALHELEYLDQETARVRLSSYAGTDLSGKYLIGSIGRFTYPKNYEFIIEVFPEIIRIKENAVLILIGYGPEEAKYRRLIEKSDLKDKVFLLNSIDKNGYKYLKGLDLFVLPSIFEGLSITIIEALAAGLPILASRVGGTPELLEDSNSQLYELNDQRMFLEKFKALASDIDSEKLKSSNLTGAKKYDINDVAQKYLKLYSS